MRVPRGSFPCAAVRPPPLGHGVRSRQPPSPNRLAFRSTLCSIPSRVFPRKTIRSARGPSSRVPRLLMRSSTWPGRSASTTNAFHAPRCSGGSRRRNRMVRCATADRAATETRTSSRGSSRLTSGVLRRAARHAVVAERTKRPWPSRPATGPGAAPSPALRDDESPAARPDLWEGPSSDASQPGRANAISSTRPATACRARSDRNRFGSTFTAVPEWGVAQPTALVASARRCSSDSRPPPDRFSPSAAQSSTTASA